MRLARHAVLIWAGVAGLGVGLIAPPVLGQNALGDGSALDRNLRQGSGGKNSRVRSVEAQIRYQESIATGNAAGGLSFRGNTGYLAPNEFRASLGANDLFILRRESAGSALGGAGLRGSDVIRGQYGVAGGAGGRTGLQAPLTLSRSGSGVLGTGSSPRATAGTYADRSLEAIVLGFRRDQEGRRVAITASPLQGVRDVPLQPTSPDAPRTRLTAPGTDPTWGGGRSEPPERLTEREFGYNADRGEETAKAGEEREPRPGSAPTNRVESSIQASLVTPQSGTYEDILSRVRESLADKERGGRDARELAVDAGRGVGAGEGGWEERLARLRASLRGDATADELDETRRPGDPLALRDPRADPRENPLMPGERDPDTADGRSPADPRDGEGEDRTDGEIEADEERDAAETLRALRNAQVRVDDLVGDRSESLGALYVDHMLAGQALLSQGRFFDAERRFESAASLQPRDPMAAIGRTHAQLGAGVFLSAAGSLRDLLAAYPEMAPARYADVLLPPADRSRLLLAKLREQIGEGRPGVAADAALLLAYLGYQRSDAVAVRDGLAALQTFTAPDDRPAAALLTLVTGVWTPETPADGGPEAGVDRKK